MIGIIEPEGFAGGELDLDIAASERAFAGLDTDFSLAQRVRYAYEMAVNNMAEGVFNVAIKNGVDPRDYSLVAFGAAGPMLLPAVLDTVHCKQVIVPPNPGLFSAIGLLAADQVFTVNRSAYLLLSPDKAPSIDAVFTEMETQLREQVGDTTAVTFLRSMDAHLVGQSWDTPFVPVPDGVIDADAVATMVTSFHDTYECRSGNRFEAMPVEGVTFRIRAVVETSKIEFPRVPVRGADEPLLPVRTTTLRFLGDIDGGGDGAQEAHVYERSTLRAGDVLSGPIIIDEGLSTTHVGTGQQATVGEYGELIIRRK
jgi:N-methylhydantoinase A